MSSPAEEPASAERTTVHSPHDRLFRFAFNDPEVARGELAAVLPESLRADLDLQTLTKEPESFIDDDLSAQYCDVLYRVRAIDDEDDVYIWILLEHQSTHHPMMPYRLFKYAAKAWFRLEQQIGKEISRSCRSSLPVVLAHDPKGWMSSHAVVS